MMSIGRLASTLYTRYQSHSKSYHSHLIQNFESPNNAGALDKNDPNVGTGLVGAPACGDVMKLQIKVDDANKIIDSKFKTFGCGAAIASSNIAPEWIKGKDLNDALNISNQDIAQHLKLPPVKLHCSMLAEDAIKAAVNHLQSSRSDKT